MSEKVLGFLYPKKWTQKQKTYEGDTVYCVAGQNIIPVRLKSESVSVEWLKKWCKKNEFGLKPPRVNTEEMLSAVEKEAGKK